MDGYRSYIESNYLQNKDVNPIAGNGYRELFEEYNDITDLLLININSINNLINKIINVENENNVPSGLLLCKFILEFIIEAKPKKLPIENVNKLSCFENNLYNKILNFIVKQEYKSLNKIYFVLSPSTQIEFSLNYIYRSSNWIHVCDVGNIIIDTRNSSNITELNGQLSNINDGDWVIFCGHGNPKGFGLDFFGQKKEILTESGLNTLFKGGNGKYNCLLLGCNGEAYKGIKVNCNCFSFQGSTDAITLDPFLIGLIRGIALNLPFDKCVELGELCFEIFGGKIETIIKHQ